MIGEAILEGYEHINFLTICPFITKYKIKVGSYYCTGRKDWKLISQSNECCEYYEATLKKSINKKTINEPETIFFEIDCMKENQEKIKVLLGL
jgi:hypothetical protein